MPRDAVSRTANVGTVGKNGFKKDRKPVKIQKENPAGCAGKVNRVKEINRRE